MTRQIFFSALVVWLLCVLVPLHGAKAQPSPETAPIENPSITPILSPDAAPVETPAPVLQRVQAGLTEPQARTASEPDAPLSAEQQALDDIPVPEKTDADVTVMEDPFAGEFVKGTPANLSKLYWYLRVFDLDDDRAVDNYMLINECDMYQRYIHDDFEWTKIRNAAREVLRRERDEYSNRFEFILPVRLGRYDTEKGGFHLVDRTAFENIRRMEITGNSISREICGRNGEIKDYPRNLMLILQKPFSYDFAKVDEHVAQAYIIRKQKEVLDLEYDSRESRYNRIAYVRLRVTLSEYQGNVKGQDGSILSILHGTLEGTDMFEDPFGKMLLSTTTYEAAPAVVVEDGMTVNATSPAPAPVPEAVPAPMPADNAPQSLQPDEGAAAETRPALPAQ